MPGTCDTYGKERKCVQGFGGETVNKQTLWRIGCKWESDIKMEFCYVDCDSVDWIHWTPEHGTGCCEDGNVFYDYMEGMEFLH